MGGVRRPTSPSNVKAKAKACFACMLPRPRSWQPPWAGSKRPWGHAAKALPSIRIWILIK